MEKFHSASLEKNLESRNAQSSMFYDPRNEEDYDTFAYGTEPIPGDHSWKHKKSPSEGLDGSDEAIPA